MGDLPDEEADFLTRSILLVAMANIPMPVFCPTLLQSWASELATSGAINLAEAVRTMLS